MRHLLAAAVAAAAGGRQDRRRNWIEKSSCRTDWMSPTSWRRLPVERSAVFFFCSGREAGEEDYSETSRGDGVAEVVRFVTEQNSALYTMYPCTHPCAHTTATVYFTVASS